MRRRSRITDEDRELFRRATSDVRRLEDDRIPPERTGRAPPTRRPTGSGPSPSRGLVESQWTPDVGPGDVSSFAREGVRHRELQRLRRGRLRVEDHLDLHERTVAEAGVALERFLTDARRRGRRCVRIVHGKGLGSRSGRPILKTYVDRWLRTRSEVLAFCSAIPPDGGTGALYVLLRR